MIYYVLFFLIAFLSLADFSDNRELRKLSHGLIALLIVFFFGFRYDLGTDTATGYKEIFNRTATGETTTIEFGYLYLMRFYMLISDSYEYFIVAIFFIAFWTKYVAIRRLTRYIGLSLLIYYCTILIGSDINQIRQGLAMGFCLLSIPYIVERKFWPFFLLVILGFTQHYTTLVFLPAYWLTRIKAKPMVMMGILALALFNFFVVKFFLLDSINIVSLLLFDEAHANKFAAYVENESEFETVLTIVTRLFFILIFILGYKRIGIPEDLKRVLVNCYFISIIIYLFVSTQPEISSRLSNYYKIIEIVLIPYLVTLFPKGVFRNLTYSGVLVYLLLLLWRVFAIPDNALLPYQNLLF